MLTSPSFRSFLFLLLVSNLRCSYIASVDRIAADGYVPDEQDILRARATTTGVYETEFEVNNAHFRYVRESREERGRLGLGSIEEVRIGVYVTNTYAGWLMLEDSELRGKSMCLCRLFVFGASLASPLRPPCVPLASPLRPPCVPLASPLRPPCVPLASPLRPPCVPLASPLRPPCVSLACPLRVPCVSLACPLRVPCVSLYLLHLVCFMNIS